MPLKESINTSVERFMKRVHEWKHSFQIAGIVALYWFVSITMVFVNKELLNGATTQDIDAPLFITWFQCFMTVVFCHIAVLVEAATVEHRRIPDVTFNAITMVKILPLSCLFIGMVTFNNFCLKYASVAFYYIGRSLTPVFNMIFTYLILYESTSLNAVCCSILIVGGYYLGIDQEEISGSLSKAGILFGTLASVFVSLNSIYTKKVLPQVNKSIWLLTYYNNLNASLLFIPLLFLFGEITHSMLLSLMDTSVFWKLMLTSSLLGFSISYVTGLQIQVSIKLPWKILIRFEQFTSPLTHNVSGTAKACVQTILACIWYQEERSYLWWFSNGIVLIGSLGYAWVRQKEMIDHLNVQKQFKETNEAKA